MGRKKLILILGGARAGKSLFAQELAKSLGEKVIFVATAEALDEEMRERIEKHRQARPKSWRTLEAPKELAKNLKRELREEEVVVIDCLTLLLSNLMREKGEAREKIRQEIEELFDLFERSKASFIFVSNEVGMGIVPEYELGRKYRDLLGEVNQFLARRADKVYFLLAGLPLELKSISVPWWSWGDLNPRPPQCH